MPDHTGRKASDVATGAVSATDLLKTSLTAGGIAVALSDDLVKSMSRGITGVLSDHYQFKKLIQGAELARPVPGHIRDIERSLERTALGIPNLEEALRKTLGNVPTMSSAASLIVEQSKIDWDQFNAQFRLPALTETAALMTQFHTSSFAETLGKSMLPGFELQRAIESMSTPWLNSANELQSLSAFTGLQRIGSVLKEMHSFSDSVGSFLRDQLGDWRDRITWPAEIFHDDLVRSDFYASKGFNRSLTDFPRPAFEESLTIAGLYDEPPLTLGYRVPKLRSEDPAEEKALQRANKAHDWLMRLETCLRRFIDEQMTRSFGTDWQKHRLPNNLYDQWKAKKEKDGSGELPLIAYADFTDYERVICKGDNWKEVFEPFFHRPETVRESFQRLHPIRLATMHSRPITQDDALFLLAETKRLINVIII